MISSKSNSNNNVASAVGGKTARACDSCIKKRARWYCAADDAFLCQGCDASVHSANPLARRHQRGRLKTASLKKPELAALDVPSWHRGFTRKARTPRPAQKIRNTLPLVPEIGADEISNEDNEEEDQLLYRVPIFDPFAAELCTSTANSNEEADDQKRTPTNHQINESKQASYDSSLQLHGFLPSEMELAEFAADVESLLGRGLENESFAMEGLGLVDYKEKECCLGNNNNSTGRVKMEEEDQQLGIVADDQNQTHDMDREVPFEFNFDHDSPATCGENEMVKREMIMTSGEDENGSRKKKKRKILLSLNYESVITAWDGQTSPWTTGDRPDFDPDNCWPDFMGAWGNELHLQQYPNYASDMGGMGTSYPMVDGGRQARVSRYREKRRTRLFSKKIRYEVRKLNAEKRPRMKGRFVKRTSFSAAGDAAGPPPFPSLLITK